MQLDSRPVGFRFPQARGKRLNLVQVDPRDAGTRHDDFWKFFSAIPLQRFLLRTLPLCATPWHHSVAESALLPRKQETAPNAKALRPLIRVSPRKCVRLQLTRHTWTTNAFSKTTGPAEMFRESAELSYTQIVSPLLTEGKGIDEGPHRDSIKLKHAIEISFQCGFADHSILIEDRSLSATCPTFEASLYSVSSSLQGEIVSKQLIPKHMLGTTIYGFTVYQHI